MRWKRINGRHLPSRFPSRVFGTASSHPLSSHTNQGKTYTAPPRPPTDMAAAAAAGSSATAALPAPLSLGDKVGAICGNRRLSGLFSPNT